MNPLDPKGEAGAKKVPLHLLPPYALAQAAWVHGFGAAKYSNKIPILYCSNGEELEKFCSCGHITEPHCAIPTDLMQQEENVLSATLKSTQKPKEPNATHQKLSGLKTYVKIVTIDFLKTIIRVIWRNSASIGENGGLCTKNIYTNIKRTTKLSRKSSIGSTKDYGLPPCQNSALLGKTNLKYSNHSQTNAPYVKARRVDKENLTSTTTTLPENSEDSFATDVIKDWASLEMILNLLKKHSLTCEVRKCQVEEGFIVFSGAWNWRKNAVCASTYVGAMKRHLDAWWDGEDVDPESLQSHLAHVIASANIVLDALAHGTLTDDRPSTI